MKAFKVIVEREGDKLNVSVYLLKGGEPTLPAMFEGSYRFWNDAVKAIGVACIYGSEL